MITTIERYLVTTENEETWEIDRPTIFLGEWCRAYSRKLIWNQIDPELHHYEVPKQISPQNIPRF